MHRKIKKILMAVINHSANGSRCLHFSPHTSYAKTRYHKQQIHLSNAGIPPDLIIGLIDHQPICWFVSGYADCPGGVLGLAYSAKITHPSRNCNTTE